MMRARSSTGVIGDLYRVAARLMAGSSRDEASSLEISLTVMSSGSDNSSSISSEAAGGVVDN